MAVAEIRFYEELNDFLPPPRRKRSLPCACARGATVKHAIEALGVPHTEVELILVDGESVDFSYIIQEGDRISVYPQFESLDITPLLRVRHQPLRRTHFVADTHLGTLVKYLRLLGFDTLYRKDWVDSELACIAARDHRIVLTRDRDLLMHRAITHGCYIRSKDPRQQLQQLISRLDLYRSVAPLSRCMHCNERLQAVEENEVADRLPPKIGRLYDRFWICGNCDRIYWKGARYKKMQSLLAGALRPPPGPSHGGEGE